MRRRRGSLTESSDAVSEHMRTVDLSQYDNAWYDPGRSAGTRLLWLCLGLPMLRSALPLPSRLRAAVLRAFGARIGHGVVIKPGVSVKYPWHLVVEEHCWIGERVWIDNLTAVHLGAHVCISQGAYLCTGNHDWTDPAFGLRIAPIQLGRGSWVGARAMLLPGTMLGEGAVAGAGSVLSGQVPANEIHAGNPAHFVRRREISDPGVPPVPAPADVSRPCAAAPVDIAVFRGDPIPSRSSAAVPTEVAR